MKKEERNSEETSSIIDFHSELTHEQDVSLFSSTTSIESIIKKIETNVKLLQESKNSEVNK